MIRKVSRRQFSCMDLEMGLEGPDLATLKIQANKIIPWTPPLKKKRNPCMILTLFVGSLLSCVHLHVYNCKKSTNDICIYVNCIYFVFV